MPPARREKMYRYEIFTPHGQAAAGEAASIVFPAFDGAFGILARHGPLVAALGAGRLTVRAPRGKTRWYFISGGVVHIRQGALTMLTEECIADQDLRLDAAFAEMERARRMPTQTLEQRELRARALETASVKFRMARDYDMHQRVRAYTAGGVPRSVDIQPAK